MDSGDVLYGAASNVNMDGNFNYIALIFQNFDHLHQFDVFVGYASIVSCNFLISTSSIFYNEANLHAYVVSI